MMIPESELMAQARRAVREQRMDDAQGILVNIVVREPENDEAWILLAETLADPERKMECLERARRLNPRNPAIQNAIRDLKTALTNAAFGQAPAAADPPPASVAAPPRAQVTAPLLEYGDTVARALLMTTNPTATRNLGLELVHLLEQALRHDETATRRWARSVGRDALVKYERALSALISSSPQSDPQLPALREQRQRALDLFK